MLLSRLFLLLLASCIGSMVSAAAAPDAELARKWAGTYSYHRGIDDDYMHITIDDVTINGTTITAKGRAKYFANTYTADVDVEWIISSDTLFIEVWDVAAANDDNDYDVSGSYRGSISRNLDKIFAIWRNWAKNDSGTLKLEAVDEFPDYQSKSGKQ